MSAMDVMLSLQYYICHFTLFSSSHFELDNTQLQIYCNTTGEYIFERLMELATKRVVYMRRTRSLPHNHLGI